LLSFAQLQGATFSRAHLQGAWLEHAQLQGASLEYAQLQGASLDGAQLQGASLFGAQLQGASLDRARLQGASLDRARLQGASLDRARLQGASLDRARLQGASLDRAQLQGASLNKARLQGASFVDACVWRADAHQAVWKDTWVAHPETGPKGDKCDWTAESFAALKQRIAKEVPESRIKHEAMERIERLLDPMKALKGEDEMAKIWAAREREAPPQRSMRKASPSNGARLDAPRRERPTCCMY
jgi:hypothetical protein